MRQGLGKMNSDTSKAAADACHSTMTATSSSQGDQVSMVFLCITLFTCVVLRMAPMWPRSSSTMSVNSFV
jgi:hypothetical protein